MKGQRQDGVSERVARGNVSSGLAVCRGVTPPATIHCARALLHSPSSTHSCTTVFQPEHFSFPPARPVGHRKRGGGSVSGGRTRRRRPSQGRLRPCSLAMQDLHFRDTMLAVQCHLVERDLRAIIGRLAVLASRYSVPLRP